MMLTSLRINKTQSFTQVLWEPFIRDPGIQVWARIEGHVRQQVGGNIDDALWKQIGAEAYWKAYHAISDAVFWRVCGDVKREIEERLQRHVGAKRGEWDWTRISRGQIIGNDRQ